MINYPLGHTVQFALIDITTVEGEQLTLDKSKLRSFRRSQSVPATQGFPVGGTAMKELVLTVDEEHVGSYNLGNASVVAYIEDGSVEHTYGTYKVVGTTKQSGICTITMYDDLNAMDKEYVSELTYPATLGAMAAEVANAHGLPAPTFDASGIICSVAPSGYTERQVLGYIAQCSGDVVMMDNGGSLVFRAFGKSAFDALGDLHVVDGLTSENYGTPVTVTGVKCTVDGENVLTGAEGYVLTVSNPLISADNVAAVQALWEEKIVGLEACSCAVQAVDDYRIECMDAIRILDSKGEYHNIYVTDITYDMQRETRIACTANEPGTQASRGRVAPVQQLQQEVKTQGTKITELEGYFERKIWKTDVEEAVSSLEVGGRNLLKNTDVFYTTTVDANQPIVQSFTAYSDLYESLIGKQLTVSIYADTTGEYMFYSGDGDPNAYIVFMCIWINSLSGQSTTQGYGISEVSVLGIDNRRVTATSETITQPSGYDKLVSVQVMIQGYAKPATEGVTWTIGRPKLEIGNVATDWTPAPEDTAKAIEDVESNAAADATAKADKALADAIADTDAKLVAYSKTTEMETAIKQSAEAIRSEASATYTTQATFESATANLQQQIDGAIETFTGSDVPTLSNSPASDWVDDVERDTHIGDLYVVNADGGDYAGFYYRFEKVGTSYQWTLLKDTEITKALQDAKEANEKAQAVADDLSANYSTTEQMNSAITQKADSITSTVAATYTTKTEFENLEVGGRNYFRPSLVKNYALASGNVVQNVAYRGYYIPVVEGGVWSISRSSTLNNRFRYAFTVDEPAANIAYYDLVTTDDALKIEGIVVPSGMNYLFLYLSNNSGELPNIKIERGSKCTDWTPAPEDVDGAIAEAEANAIADTDNKLNSTGEASGKPITITDATDAELQDVTIYGKSTQASTPTPDATIDFVSIGDSGSTTVYARGRNLFDASRVTTNTAGGATVANNGDGSFTVSGSGSLTAGFSQGYDYTLAEMSIITPGTYTLSTSSVSTYPMFAVQFITASGSVTSIVASNSAIKGATGGTFTVTQTMIDSGYRLRLRMYGASGNAITGGTFYPMVYKGTETLDIEPYKETTATITENLPLRGLKVIYDYNHTDASGQTWDCDVLEKYTDGTGKYIQRIRYFEFDGSDDESWTAYNGYFRYAVTGLYVGGAGLCNICPVKTGTFSSNGVYYNAGFIYFRYDDLSVNGTDMTVADFKTWLAEHPMKLLARLATPIETDLTADQVSAFEDLMSYKDCTNVFNPDGADIKVTYIRDTPLADTVSRVSKSESKITQLADEIELKVDKDGVISAINLSPEVVKILAKYIQLEGIVTANGYFKILEDGSMEAVNGTFTSYQVDGTTGSAMLKDGKVILKTRKEERTDNDDGGYVIEEKDYTIELDSSSGKITVAESVTETAYDASGTAINTNSYSQAWTPIDFAMDEAFFNWLTIAVGAEITNLYVENLRVTGDSYAITATANATTLLADFSGYENGGIYEVLIWNDNHTEYFTACKSPASVALSAVTRSTTLSLATSSTGQYTVGIKNSGSVDHYVYVRVIKKNY